MLSLARVFHEVKECHVRHSVAFFVLSSFAAHWPRNGAFKRFRMTRVVGRMGW